MMRVFMGGLALALSTLLAAVGCQPNAQLVRVDAVEPGVICEAGGLVVRTGIDDNENGTLEQSEFDTSEPVCNGADGRPSLVRLVDEPPGPNCPFGGIQVQSGVDDNGDGELDENEVDSIGYSCTARSSLVVSDPEDPGSNCPAGGTRIRSGVDADGDGFLDDAEVRDTTYVCSGRDAEQIAVRMVPLAVGATCVNGGWTIQWGVDDDRDGDLADAEVDRERYICHGSAGAPALVALDPEPAGLNCLAGGTRVRSGVDADADGILTLLETSSTSFVCHAAESVAATYRQRLVESPGVADRLFGAGVATDGHTAVVTSGRAVGGQRTTFVFDRQYPWTPWQVRTALSLPAVGNAGDRADVNGGVIAITAPNDPTEGPDHGAVYVYEWDGVAWGPTAQLLSGGASTIGFGIDVAVAGDVIAVLSSGLEGRLFIFQRDAASGAWLRRQVIAFPNPGTQSAYGLAMRGDVIAVSGTITAAGSRRGAVWLYHYEPAPGTWQYVQELRPQSCCAPIAQSERYGVDIDIEGARVIVSDPDGGDYGRALVFQGVLGAGWIERGALTPADAGPTLRVGGTVSIAGDIATVTMADDELVQGGASTRVFRFEGSGGWIERQRLLSPDLLFDDGFGAAVAAEGDTLLVCSSTTSTPTAAHSGACHDYKLNP